MPTPQQRQPQVDWSTAQPIHPQVDWSTAQPIHASPGQMPARPAGLPAGVDLPGLPASPAPAPPGLSGPPTVLERMAAPDRTPITNLAKGVVKSGVATFANLNRLTAPVARVLSPEFYPGQHAEEQQRLDSLAQTHGTAQQVGKVAGDIGQFFIPGPGEEAGAAALAPYVGRALPAVRVGLSALGAGAVNKAEGGSFGAGAAGGALGAGIGMGLQKIAPDLAEIAIGTRAPDRAFGRKIGQFIINRTAGNDLSGVTQQANQIATDASNELDQRAFNSTVPVNLTPARSVANSFLRTAELQNNPDMVRDVAQVGSQLSSRGSVPIPSPVSAHEALALKRGLTALTTYSPTMTNGLGDAAVKSTVSALQPELSSAIPGYDALNDTISTAIPVAKRAGATDLNAGVLQRVVGRFARPTGALAGAGFGGYEGSKEGGLAGGLIGAGLGLVAPEYLASPKFLLTAARNINEFAPAAGKLANASAQQVVQKR